MKKIKNKKSSPIQIKTPQSQITTLWNSPVSTVLVGFFFFFFPRSVSQFLCLHSFLFFFLLLFLLSPSILMLSLLELSLSLDFAQTQTQTHMPQAPLSNQWVSLFGIFFLWVSMHMVLPTCHGEVEGMGLWGSAWWRSEFVDRHGGGCGFVVIGVYGGVLVMAQIRVWIGRWWIAWLFRWLDR